MTKSLAPPADLTDRTAQAWFESVAEILLNRTSWIVGSREFHLAEIEFYYHSPLHLDPFPHRHPLQTQPGRWFFHRVGRGFRGGTRKGLDLTFGNGASFGGILIRGVRFAEKHDPVLSGPSLLVDLLLRLLNASTVAELHEIVGSRDAWDRTAPMYLQLTRDRQQPIYASSRVGLTLNSGDASSMQAEYLIRDYRFLVEPRLARAGLPQLVIACHRRGRSPAEIARLTGSKLHSVTRHLAAYSRGLTEGSLADYCGRNMRVHELSELLGVSQRVVGSHMPDPASH